MDWLNFAFAFVGMAVAAYFTVYAMRRKTLCYWSVTKRLPAPEYGDGIGLTFEGRPVADLYLHDLFFWNSGNIEILGEDVIDKLGFTTSPPSKLIKLRSVLCTQTPPIDISADGDNLHVSFQSLNPGEGMWVEVMQGFETSLISQPKIGFTGSVSGLTNRIAQREARPLIDLFYTFKYSFISEALLLGGVGTWYILANFNGNKFVAFALLALMMLTVAATMLAEFWRTPLLNVPKEFMPFWDQFRWMPK